MLGVRRSRGRPAQAVTTRSGGSAVPSRALRALWATARPPRTVADARSRRALGVPKARSARRSRRRRRLLQAVPQRTWDRAVVGSVLEPSWRASITACRRRRCGAAVADEHSHPSGPAPARRHAPAAGCRRRERHTARSASGRASSCGSEEQPRRSTAGRRIFGATRADAGAPRCPAAPVGLVHLAGQRHRRSGRASAGRTRPSALREHRRRAEPAPTPLGWPLSSSGALNVISSPRFDEVRSFPPSPP